MNTLVNEKIVNSLLNDNTFSTEIKAMLNQMIDEELVKDIDEMDCDLIEECTNMLIALEQQDDDGFAVIIPLISSEKIMAACTENRFRYLSRGLRASIIAAIILFSAFTTNTVIAKVFDYNIAQEVVNTITEKLEDWGVIASAEDRNEITVEKIPYEKTNNLPESESITQPAQRIETPIKEVVNKAPPQNSTTESEDNKTEDTPPAESETDNTVNQPTDETVNQTYTLTFEIKGDDSYKYSKTVTYGKPIGELPTVSKEGYKFVGWYNVDISYYREHGKKIETPLKSTTIYNLEQDAVVVAKWNQLVTINFDPAGGSCDTESIQISYLSSVTDLPVPVREGYIFLGWYDGKNDELHFTTENLYTNGFGNGYLNLSAFWAEEGEMRTVTFYIESGWGSCDVEEKEYMVGFPYGELPTPIPSPDIPELKFLGWGGIPEELDACEYIMIDENTIFNRYDILVARWYTTKAVVTFDANGGECDVKNKTIYSYNYYGNLPTPTKDGYTFIGWYRDDIGEQINGDVYLDEEYTVDHTLIAMWEPIKIPITFSANGGLMNKGGDASLTENYNYMQPFSNFPVASRVGYRFIGWYTEPVGGKKIEEADIVDFLDTAIYYAHWEKDEDTCVVIFHSNDGKDNNSIVTFKKGDEIISSKAPDMSGLEKLLYKFTGWYTDKYYGEKIDENMTVTENMELYAHWEFNNNMVKINYELQLDKTNYMLNEEIDPSTVSMVVKIPLTGFSETITPEMLKEANAIYDYDTSTPGTHTLTVTAAIESGYVITFRASADITVNDTPYNGETEITKITEPAYTKNEYADDISDKQKLTPTV